MQWLRAGIAVVIASCTLPSAAGAATYSVTDHSDTAGTCPALVGCTLRQAVTSANAGAGADTIVVQGGAYALTLGALPVTDALTVQGSGPPAVTISPSGSRAFTAAAPLTLESLDIDGASASAASVQGGAIFTTDAITLTDVRIDASSVTGTTTANGGAIAALGPSLTIARGTFSGNSASGGSASGGAIYTSGTTALTVTDSTFDANTAAATGINAGVGGAIAANGATVELHHDVISANHATGTRATGGGLWRGPGGTTTVTDTRITGNGASGTGTTLGGGAWLSGPSTITGSTIDANSAVVTGAAAAAGGGGLALDGASPATITDSTVFANEVRAAAASSAAVGGGLYLGASASSLLATTVSANIASGAGGGTIAGGGVAANGTPFSLTITGSILSANVQPDAGADCANATLVSGGGNVVNQVDGASSCSYTAGATDVVTDTPGVGALADNGGPTPTALLTAGSPALDRYTTGCPAVDQRGVSRPQGPACDAGAVEMLVPTPPAPPSGGGGGGGGPVPQCDDLVGVTPFATPIGLKLTCSALVWNWVVTRAPSHGTLSAITADGEIGYTPEAGFSGEDTFTYVAQGGGGQSAPALVTVHVGDGPVTAASLAPAAPTCASRRVTVRLNRRGEHFVRARVTVDGRRVKTRRERTRWTATFDARGTVTVRVSGRRDDGRLVRRTRTLTLC